LQSIRGEPRGGDAFFISGSEGKPVRVKGLLAVVAAATLMVTTAVGASASVLTTSRSCAQPDGRVSAIAISARTVYLGGSFTAVKDRQGVNRPRARLAAVDAVTCDLLPWNPGADGDVYALEAVDGTVYAGGAFLSVGGQARTRLAALDSASGSLLPFHPRLDRPVRALLSSGGSLFAGGDFTKVDATARSRLAAFSLPSNTLDDTWKPSAAGAVYTLALSADGGSVYAGGNFSRLNGDAALAYLGAVDAVSGATAGAFRPGAQFPILDVVADARGVYAGAGGSGGHLVIWNLDGTLQQPVYQTDGGVQTVAVDGDSLYAGGHFASYCQGNTGSGHPFICDRPLSRRKLFEISLATGELTAWAPVLNSPRGVFAAVVDPATHDLWVGGDFTKVNGQPTAHLATFPAT